MRDSDPHFPGLYRCKLPGQSQRVGPDFTLCRAPGRNLVDNQGIEPCLSRCKRDVFPAYSSPKIFETTGVRN